MLARVVPAEGATRRGTVQRALLLTPYAAETHRPKSATARRTRRRPRDQAARARGRRRDRRACARCSRALVERGVPRAREPEPLTHLAGTSTRRLTLPLERRQRGVRSFAPPAMDDAELRRAPRAVPARAPCPMRSTLRVIALERSTEGFSQETFSFDAERRATGGVDGAPSCSSGSRWRVCSSRTTSSPSSACCTRCRPIRCPRRRRPGSSVTRRCWSASFYVMERLPGDVPIPVAGPDGAGPFDDAERAALGPRRGRCARAAARHRLARARTRISSAIPGPVRAAAARELERWEARIARAAGWPSIRPSPRPSGGCARTCPRPPEITLVHGDFRLGTSWSPETRAGPADAASSTGRWSISAIPLEDVAWCISPLWRGGTRVRLRRCSSPDDFVERWAEATRPRSRPGAPALLSACSRSSR